MRNKRTQMDLFMGPVTKIYGQIEEELIETIASYLVKNESLLDEDVMAWRTEHLYSLGALTEDAVEIMARLSGMAEERVYEAIEKAGYAQVAESDERFNKAKSAGYRLSDPPAATEDSNLNRTLLAMQNQAADKMNLVNTTLLRQSPQVYTDILNKTTAKAAAGYVTPRQAMKQAAKEMARKGMPAFVKDGRQWSTEAYVQMNMRTTINNTTNQMQDERMTSWGHDLVEVTSHAGARELCAPYQGLIYTTSSGPSDYPNLYGDTSYGEPAGLFGINCGHFRYEYFPGLSRQVYEPMPESENERIYEESQEQRRIEREIRAAKREQTMMKGLKDEQGIKEANQRVNARQQKMRDFIDRTDRTRRRDREQLL